MNFYEEHAVRFLHAFGEAGADDLDGLMELCDPDVKIHIFGPTYPVACGQEQVRRALTKLYSQIPTGVKFNVRNVASTGNTVFIERWDIASDVDPTLDQGSEGFPVVGIGEVGEDGKILAWRDYFDTAPLAKEGFKGEEILSELFESH